MRRRIGPPEPGPPRRPPVSGSVSEASPALGSSYAGGRCAGTAWPRQSSCAAAESEGGSRGASCCCRLPFTRERERGRSTILHKRAMAEPSSADASASSGTQSTLSWHVWPFNFSSTSSNASTYLIYPLPNIWRKTGCDALYLGRGIFI